MKNKLEELYKEIKPYGYIFLDEDYINVDDIEDELNYRRDSDIGIEGKLTLPIYAPKKINKPNFTFEDLGEKLEACDYGTDSAWNTDLIEKDKETLKKINELFHSLVSPIYNSDKKIGTIVIYADENKEIDFIKESK